MTRAFSPCGTNHPPRTGHGRLFFEECRVPKGNLLGAEEGKGFVQMMIKLQQERLICAISSFAVIWGVLEWTKRYCEERVCFRKPIIKFQNTRFKLVEMYTMAEALQAFMDRLVREHMNGADVFSEASMAKRICDHEGDYRQATGHVTDETWIESFAQSAVKTARTLT